MILTDKPYIEVPPDDTPLMHYLNIYQLLSILQREEIALSAVSLYKDASEATLTSPSYKKVLDHLLLEDNTPVQKDENYISRKRLATDHELYEYYRKFDHTFACLIRDFSRHFMFTHCWSIADTENILMWDRYRHQGSTIAIKTTMNRIENALNESPYLLYISKVQYKDYNTEHIMGFENFAERNLSDPEIIEELFYQPIFHKQKLYESEKEVRIVISYKYVTEKTLGKTYLTDIPFYNDGWCFNKDPDPYSGGSGKSHAVFWDEEDKLHIIPRRKYAKVNINELIENVILSPYTEPYALSLIQDAVNQYGIDPDKVVNSSIRFR